MLAATYLEVELIGYIGGVIVALLVHSFVRKYVIAVVSAATMMSVATMAADAHFRGELSGIWPIGLVVWFGLELLIAAAVGRPFLWYRSRKARRCPTCGYHLTSSVSGTCPECGTPIGPPTHNEP